MKNDEVIARIRQKRLVFTVATGRSGTAYLASILGFEQNVYSKHEPKPEFVDVLREVQGSQDLARHFWLEEKLPAIANIPADVYIETSHLACKGFLEPLLEIGIIPDLIIHRRAPRDVAISMLQMGTIPGRSDKGLRFYLSPEDPGVLEISNWKRLQDFQLCYWYCLEVERRAQMYKTLFLKNGARITETTLSGLKTIHGLKRCLSDLNLQLKFPEWFTNIRFLRSTRVKVNESLETKKETTIPDNIIELEQEVLDRLVDQVQCDIFSEMISLKG